MGREVMLPEILEGKLKWDTRSSLRRGAIGVCNQFSRENPICVFRSVVTTTLSIRCTGYFLPFLLPQQRVAGKVITFAHSPSQLRETSW